MRNAILGGLIIISICYYGYYDLNKKFNEKVDYIEKNYTLSWYADTPILSDTGSGIKEYEISKINRVLFEPDGEMRTFYQNGRVAVYTNAWTWKGWQDDDGRVYKNRWNKEKKEWYRAYLIDLGEK